MKKVAVVEDSPEIRLLLTVVLSRSYEVDEYADGEAALQGLTRRVPDLVLLDISLPGIDGTEVLARLRADPALAGLPVIAVTAYASEAERQRFLELGFDDHLSKPITNFQTLLDTVERHLQRAA